MDIPLQFHEFHPLNHTEKCPKFADVLKGTDANLQFNDLDALYTDLETLQGAANIRLRRLDEEVKILSEWCDKRDRISGIKGEIERDLFSNTASTSSTASSSAVTSKRTRSGQTDEAKLSKKQKVDEPAKATLTKSRNKSKPADSSESEVISKPKLSYDAPNKFWSLVEPYCSDILPEHISALEDSLCSKADVSEYYKVPPLGKHYSEVWSKEDFLEEQQQSSKIDKKRTSPVHADEKLASKAMTSSESCAYGSFTKKLIAALVDENIMAPMCETGLREAGGATKQEEHKSEKKKSSHYARSLEHAIKEELFSLGLIDSLEDEEEEDDEILSELRRLQSDLRAVRSHNKHNVNKLVARAKTAMRKQEVVQKAKVADTEVTEVFRRISSSRSKKKGVSRKDRELAWKAYNERKALWELVDNDTTTTGEDPT